MSSMGADFRDLDNDGLPTLCSLTLAGGQPLTVGKNRGGASISYMNVKLEINPLTTDIQPLGCGHRRL